jgi:hypothetical protein
MTATSPESLALLDRAAELRASGVPWPDAATRLALGHEELRRLVSEHSRDYERLVRRARTEVLRETLDAALTALRALVTSPEPGVGLKAATTIVRYDLARMRYDLKEAGDRLARKRRKITAEAENVRAQNVSESSKGQDQQEVNAAKNVAQSPAPDAPAKPPVPPPAPARPAAPPAAKSTTPDAEAIRRKRLFRAAVLGQPAPRTPLTKGVRQTLEVDRLISSWLAEG